MSWHADTDLLAAYTDGSLDAIAGASVEQHLAHCSDCRTAIRSHTDLPGLDLAWDQVRRRVEQPLLPGPVRLAQRLGLGEPTSILLAATASMRTAWLVNALVALGFATVAAALAEDDAPMSTLATALAGVDELFDPNCVKVVRRADGHALYFSRAPLPWPRDAFARNRDALPSDSPFLRHIGIYAYRAGFLRRFTTLAPTPLEKLESLEQLRALEHGYAIAVCIAPEPFPAGVDTAADLARVERELAGRAAG